MQAAPALALATQAAGAVTGGLMQNAAGKAEQRRNEVNAYIGRTRAIQTDVSSRKGLEAELGTMRAALAGNGDNPSVGTFEIMKELRETRDRDRRIQFGARMSEAADYRMAGQNAAAKGRAGLIGGFINAAPSMFDLYQLKGK